MHRVSVLVPLFKNHRSDVYLWPLLHRDISSLPINIPLGGKGKGGVRLRGVKEGGGGGGGEMALLDYELY